MVRTSSGRIGVHESYDRIARRAPESIESIFDRQHMFWHNVCGGYAGGSWDEVFAHVRDCKGRMGDGGLVVHTHTLNPFMKGKVHTGYTITLRLSRVHVASFPKTPKNDTRRKNR
jgi:hypothetical protein